MDTFSKDFNFSEDTVGWRQDLWRRVLRDIAQQPTLRLLEIGTFEGRTLIWLMTEIFKSSSAQADVIDPFVGGTELTLKKNLQVAGLLDRVSIYNGDSNQVLRKLSGPYDVVYVDGCHCSRHVLADAVLAWDLLRPGGIMMFDDYEFDQTGVFKRIPHSHPGNCPRVAIDAFLKCYESELDVIHKDYELVVRKTGIVHD